MIKKDKNKHIVIKGAKENNLKSMDLVIPRDSFVVVTGLSGSGKSSLVFDTLFQEGQRRYVESLSPYARQFLGGIKKPNVDSIEGLSPAISIDQKTVGHTPRSIVATMTEIYDYLRLVWARIGKIFCPNGHGEIKAQSVSKIVDTIFDTHKSGEKIRILSPIASEKKGTFQLLFNDLRSDGFTRVLIDGFIYPLNDFPKLNKNTKHNISILIDTLIFDKKNKDLRSRVYTGVEQSGKYGNGMINVEVLDKDNKVTKSTHYSQHHMCPKCGFSIPNPSPNMFSFNSPNGACSLCKGLGISLEVDVDKLIPNQALSINEGAIQYMKSTIGTSNIEWQMLETVAKEYRIDMDKPFQKLSKEEKNTILYGTPDAIEYSILSSGGNTFKRNEHIEGICRRIERRYTETDSQGMRDYYQKFMTEVKCKKCQGQRLSRESLSVKINKLSIIDFIRMTIKQATIWLEKLELTPEQMKIIELAISEVVSRISFLNRMGLDYLTLDRAAKTLSGGESQRIRLATQIGSLLTGVVYVLDEPSIGLHQKDNIKLIKALKEMRDNGNTLVVVEHDEETIRSADWVVDIGPGAGVYGGEVVAQGKISDIEKSKTSVTGPYISGKKKIEIPTKRRGGNGKLLTIKGAEENNLQKINVKFPLGKLICVTGVSGSGKSTLVSNILYNGIHNSINPIHRHKVGKHGGILGLDNIDKIINISQTPIGRTSRSTPATYTKVFDEIRLVYANTKESAIRGYTASRFSFNNKEGRCEKCRGHGKRVIPMHFLPDVSILCDECNGSRYNEETLQVLYRGKNIGEVLDLTIDEAYDFFENHNKIQHTLKIMKDVGLSYINLGHSATILSGGEAQRIKLALHLQKLPTGKTIYLLDEPTTGLHMEDVQKLINVLNRLVDHGDTVVVIEHNLDLIKVSDYVIDLGPDGGDNGGTIVASGTPEQVSKVKGSYTGQYLELILNK